MIGTDVRVEAVNTRQQRQPLPRSAPLNNAPVAVTGRDFPALARVIHVSSSHPSPCSYLYSVERPSMMLERTDIKFRCHRDNYLVRHVYGVFGARSAALASPFQPVDSSPEIQTRPSGPEWVSQVAGSALYVLHLRNVNLREDSRAMLLAASY